MVGVAHSEVMVLKPDGLSNFIPLGTSDFVLCIDVCPLFDGIRNHLVCARAYSVNCCICHWF